ncbi:MAG TPA: CotH kinase family protein [Verrucomicrobiae bacterium]
MAANSTPDQRVQHLQERPRQIVQRRSIHEGDQLHREEFAIKGKVDSKLPIYEIKIAPAHIEQMDMNPRGEQTYPATFTANGVAYENVKIRYRGQWGRTWPKKPLKIFFNDDKQFDDQKRLNLNSSFRDPSFIRETVAYHVYRTAGVPSSRSQLVRVHMNGEFRGLYVQVEQPDKSFLKWHNLKGAAIIKANSKMKASDERTYGDLDEFRMHYEQETDKDEDAFPQLKKFCDKMENAKNADEFFEKNVDLEKYVNYLAASALCQNWDGYNKNHFMVLDRDGSKKWFVLPWDLDRAMGDHWDWSFGRADLPIALGTEEIPAVTGWNRMQDRFFSSPKLRARLADRIQGLLEKEFTTEKLDPIIDQLHASIRPEAELDYKRWPNPGMEWWRDEKPGLDAHVKVVKQFIRDRRDYLKRELPKLRGNQSARAALN